MYDSLIQNLKMVWKEVFDIELDYPKGIIQSFQKDIPNLPISISSFISGNPLFTIEKNTKVISLEELMEIKKDTDLTYQDKLPNTIDDILQFIEKFNFKVGEKYIDSVDVVRSDNIFNSRDIFDSCYIFDSKDIAFSRQLGNCAYTYFSNNTSDSEFCIKVKDSSLLSNCYQVGWSTKCSSSFFCYDCYDIRDCMFCFHLLSKRYCIANIQMSRAEYKKAKTEILGELAKAHYELDII